MTAYAPQETEWIKSQIRNYNCHAGDKKALVKVIDIY